MRIGQVSRKYNISVNNIYFYINYGLIVPPKPGGQYVFDEKTLRDLEMILELKEMEFSLKDIHHILSLFRVSQLEDEQDIEDLRQLYKKQAQLLLQKQELLHKAVENIQLKISTLDLQLKKPETKIGLPVSMLRYLCCPHCGNDLELNQVNMNKNYIYNGQLCCACGYQASVEEGVLITPNRNQSRYDKPEVTRNLYKDLPPALISLFQVSYNWMTERLKRLGTKNKLLLESYINAWFFLHNHQHVLDPDCQIIVLDKFPETLHYFKDLIDRQKYGLDILYIADSSVNPPLRPHIVDINIDFFAVNEHNFYHHDFWLDHLQRYLKENAHILGTYFHFENGEKSQRRLRREYLESYQLNFSKEYFSRSLARHYQLLEQQDAGYTTDSGENLGFSFHVSGEKMHLMPYFGRVQA